MKFLITLLLLVAPTFSASNWLSQPRILSTSSAAFTSLSNSGLTTHFLTCGGTSGHLSLWQVSVRATAAATIDVCAASNVKGVCTTAGSVTNDTKQELSTGDTVILGYSQTLGSVASSEMTTFTKISGNIVAHRYCVRSEVIRR